MLISVVIPVYKAETYVKAAVESALNQPDTGEVLLVEDNSPDGSLEVCKTLAESHQRVRLIRHPGGENRGAGASRNLGIKSAKHDHIAFLDADDVYLPGRFDVPRQLFQTHPDIDGVYEAVGTHFENSVVRERWTSAGGKELTTLSERLKPEHLFDALVNGGKGHLHLDGILVKKRIFNRCGYFFENLRLHQDSAMMVQMAESGILIPGRLDTPVAMRRVHAGNRFSLVKDMRATFTQRDRALLWWAVRKGADRKKVNDLAHCFLARSARLLLHPSAGPREWGENLIALLQFFLRHPLIAGRSLVEFPKRRAEQKKKLELLCCQKN
jgi:hypothetical protein